MKLDKSYKERLPEITTLIFDIDGVFTNGSVLLLPDGQIVRQMGSKDSYAVQYAIRKGYRLAVMTGGNSLAVYEALKRLGIKHVYMDCANKLEVYNQFMAAEKLSDAEVLYMGDDIPDHQVMRRAAVAACPADAAEEIKRISHYVSARKGGEGCVRDIIEQTMKVQGKWFDHDAHIW